MDENIDINTTSSILKIISPSLSIVINTQTPNRQLWYSSTLSGPQRFDYVSDKKEWINQGGSKIEDVFLKDIKQIS